MKKVLALSVTFAMCTSLAFAQPPKKHRRAVPPAFDSKTFEGVFYDDVPSQLVGSLPSLNKSATGAQVVANAQENGSVNEESNVWKSRIDASTIEDLVKSAKVRLDPAVSSPAKFAGGGYLIARREFTLLAALFAVIEQYPGDIRWKHSAARAKNDFARIAANAKVGSIPAYNEAKAKTQIFGDLLRGERLDASKEEPSDWSASMDRVALMQLLEWAYRDVMNPAVANEAAFKENQNTLRQNGQLAATIGEILLQEGMSDIESDEYVQWMKEMIAASESVAIAADKQEMALARESLSKIDKSCNTCHDSFR